MASEIADLLNIALKTGITQKELHKEVVAAVTQAYLLWMHKDADPDIEINVDFLLGRVSIFKNSNDITPKDFTDVAEKTLREILIKIINKRLDIVLLNHNKSLTKQNPATDTLDYLKQYIFWALNVGYLLIMIGFILLFISKDGGATLNNILPNITFIHGALMGLLVITPILSLYLAIAHNPTHNANKLIQILVKFEVPLIVLSLFLINTLANTAPAVWVIGIIMLLIPVVEFIKLRKKDTSKKVKIISYTIWVIVTTIIAYSSLILTFFLPYYLIEIYQGVEKYIESIIESARDGDIATMNVRMFVELPIRAVGVLFILTLLAMPYIMIHLFTKSVSKRAKQLTSMYTQRTIKWVTIGSAALLCAVLVLSNTGLYADNKLLTMLNKDLESLTYEEKEQIAKELIPQREKVDNSIKKAQTDQDKYLFRKSNKTVQRLYEDKIGRKNKFFEIIQNLFNIVAFPITYQGPEINMAKLDKAYKQIYGEKFESKQDPSATPATTQQAKNVIRVTREYTITPIANGAFAKISVDDQFANAQFSNQEVRYEFTLPQEAVITDLKLGMNLEFQGQIAPRGAAWRTYQQQLRQQRDPALLEQIGPTQYRLRVFPIPPKTVTQAENVPQQRVRFSYIVAITPQGYPLPKWTKEDNVKGISNAVVTFNNKVQIIADDERTIPAQKTIEEICAQKNPVILKTKMNTAIATPTPTLCGKAQKPSGKRIALFYDTSAQRKESKQWHDVKKIMTKELLEKNTLNIYFFNTNISARKNSTDTPIYFGERGDLSKINIKKGEYDEVIIITDKKFNLTENTINHLSVVPKIYIIYETDAIPAFTLSVARALIQNKVTVSDSLQDVMTISAYTNNMGDDKLITPFWIIEETKEKNISPNELEPIITRININNKIHNTKGELENNREIMQPLHEQARAAKIVTIFSSYIALVNETQQQTLQKESQTEYAYTEINARHSQSETRTVTPIRPTGPIYNFAIGEYGIHDIVKLAIIITVLITAGGVILVGAKYIKQNIQK